MPKIGLSVSLCCQAMAAGEVDPNDVEKIIARTCARDDEGWNRVIQHYVEGRWPISISARAAEIAHQFWKAGKIQQPRLVDDRMPDITRGIWVESEDEVIYITCE